MQVSCGAVLVLLLGIMGVGSLGCVHAGGRPAGTAAEGRTPAADGVEIAYTVRGAGETALVLIHGGLADRAFWAPQLAVLAGDYTVVALDLGGHGASGRARTRWTIASWGGDVRAVV